MAEQIGLQATLDIDDFLRNAGRYQGAIDDMDSKTASFAGAAVGHFQSFGSAALKASAVVATASAAVVSAIGAWVGKGVLDAADLEEKISGIVSILDGDTVKAFGGAEKAAAAFDKEITDLGLDPNLKVTATEAADAINQLVSAGVPAQDVLNGAAHSTVLLANATGADLTMAANIAAHSMSIFGIKTGDLEDAVSNIAGVVGQSTFTINDYNLALAAGGGVAASVGVSFEDFNATIAATSPLFSSGSDAGTSFKTFLQRLTPQTDKAAAEMERLGLNFYNADGSMKSMTEVSGLLQKAFSGLTEEQKNQSASIIFGTDAMRTAFALASTGAEKFDELKNSIDSVDANQQAIIRVTNLKGAFEILQGQVDAVQSAIGKKFLPVLRELTQWASEFVSQYGHQLIDFFGQVATAIDTFRNALANGVSPMSAFFVAMAVFGETGIYVATIIQSIVKKTQLFVTAATAMLSPIFSAIASFVSWKDVLITVGLAIASVVIPAIWGFITAIAPVIAVVGAVLIAVSALRNAWESDFLGIQTNTIAAITYISGALAPFTSAITEHFGGALTEIKNWALGNQTEFTNVSAIWEGAKTSANTLFTDLSGYVTTNLSIWTATLTEWGNAAWQWIVDSIPIVTQKLTEWYTALATYVITNYPTWLAAMALWGDAIWQWIVDSIPVVAQKLIEWYTALSTWVTDNWPTWKAKLIEWANVLWQWVLDAIPVITEKLGEWYTALSNWVTENWPTWKAKLLEWANVLWGWIVDAAGLVGEKLSEWYAALEQYVIDNLPTWKAKLLEWANAAWGWIVDAAGQVGTKLGEWYAALSQYVTDNLPTWKAKLLEWANAAWEWIKDAAGKVGEKLSEWYAALKQYVTDNLPSWKAKLLEWAGALWEWIKDAVSKIPGELTAWYTSLSGAIAEKLPTLKTKMLEWATALVGWIGDKAADALPELGKWMGKILAWIALAPLALGVGLAKLAVKLVSWISGEGADSGEESAVSKTDPAMDKFKEALNTAIGKIWGGIKAAVWALLDAWYKEMTTYVDWNKLGTTVIDSIVSGVGALVEGKNPIVKKFDEIIEAGKKAWKDAVASFKQIGIDIIQGIIDGAGTMGEALSTYFSDLVSGLVQKVKTALGISSPSKVFMAIGRYVIQGFMAGIKDEWAIHQGEFKDLFLLAPLKPLEISSDTSLGLTNLKDVQTVFKSLVESFKSFNLLAGSTGESKYGALQVQLKDTNALLDAQIDLLDNIEKSGIDPRSIIGNTVFGLGADPIKISDGIVSVLQRVQQQVAQGVSARKDSIINKFILKPFTDALTNQAQVIADTLKNVATDFGKIRIDRLLAQIADVDKQIATYIEIGNRQGLTFDEQSRFRDLVNQRGILAAQIGATSSIESFFGISNEATRLEQMKKQVDLLKQARDLSADIPADAFGNIANDSTLRALIEVYAHVQNAQLNQTQAQLSALQSNNIQTQLNQYKAQQTALDSQLALLQKAKGLGLQLSGESTFGVNTSQSDINNLTLRIAQEQLRRTQNELALVQGIPDRLLNLSPTNSVAQLYKSQVLDPMLKALREAVLLDSQRADLMAKYVAGAERVQALNDKQSQLDYLKFQTDLIKQVNDTFSAAGAKTVLADTHFGLDASLDDLLAFATRMVNGMVNKVKNGLGIASPSKVFIDIGQRVMQGFSRGMESMADKPIMAINQALRPLPYAYAGGQRTMNVNMGGVSISNGMDDVMFEHRVRQVVEGMMA